MKTKYVVLFIVAALAAMFLAGYITGDRMSRPEVVTHTDTLTVIDTVTIREPVAVEQYVVRTELVPLIDTIKVHDTLYVTLPVKNKHYQDSLFDAWVSGYNASLDSIRVYPVTRYVTTESIVMVPDKKRWGIGVQAGYGVGANGLTPYIGVGITYNVVRF